MKINSLLAGTLALVLVAGLVTPAFANPANLQNLKPNAPSTPSVFLVGADFTVTDAVVVSQIDCYTFDATSVGAGAGDAFYAAIDNDIGGPNPDTVLGTFSAAGCNVSDKLDDNDDDSPFGDGAADALGGVVNPDGNIYLAVSGYSDFDFDGSHSQEGPYDLSVIIGGDDGNNSLGEAEVISGCAFTSPEPADVTPRPGSVTATITRTGGGDDVDFYQINVPLGGASLIADLDNDPFIFDTVMSVFDSDGTLIAVNDDYDTDDGSADSLDSFIGQLILANPGTYYVAVSQYSNFPDASCAGGNSLDISGEEQLGCDFGDSSFDEAPGADPGLPYKLHLSLLDAGLICSAVGGELLSIDSTALILAGAQTNAIWIMSALAVIGSVAFGTIYITTKKN